MKDKSNLIIQGIILVGAIFFGRLALINFDYFKWFLIHFAIPFVVLSVIGIRITDNTEKMYDYFFRLAAFTFVIGMAMKFFTMWEVEFVPLWATVAFTIIGGYLWLQTLDLKNIVKQLNEEIIRRIKK